MEDSRQDLRTEDEKRSEDGGMRMEELTVCVSGISKVYRGR